MNKGYETSKRQKIPTDLCWHVGPKTMQVDIDSILDKRKSHKDDSNIDNNDHRTKKNAIQGRNQWLGSTCPYGQKTK